HAAQKCWIILSHLITQLLSKIWKLPELSTLASLIWMSLRWVLRMKPATMAQSKTHGILNAYLAALQADHLLLYLQGWFLLPLEQTLADPSDNRLLYVV